MAFTYTTRKDGRLMKKITIKGKPIYLYSNDVKDLEKQYIEIKYNSYNTKIENKSINMKDYCLHWLELNSIHIELRTKNDYEYLINSHIIPNIGYMKITNISKNDIMELMKKMENIPTTAKKALQLIKRILNEAIDNDIINKNVASNIKPPRLVKKEKIPLSKDLDDKLLTSNNKYALFFILMRYTGMRKEEIVPITINDIDLTNKTITINKAVTFIHNQPILKSTKNKKSRVVPILDIIYDKVEFLYNTAIKEKRKLLFVKESDKKMLTDSAIKRHLESLLYDLDNNKNIKFTCHQLRHSYCTMLYYAGIKIKEAQNLMRSFFC